MSDGSKIQYIDASANPLPGCGRKLESRGCAQCWAISMARRLGAMHVRGYDGLVDGGAWTGRHGWVPSELEKLRAWKRPRVVFVNSMGDLFADGVPDWQLALTFAGMELAPQHTYLVLTKRPARMRAFSLVRDFPANLWAGVSVCTQADADRFLPDLVATVAAHRWVSVEPMLERIDFRSGGTYGGGWLDDYDTEPEHASDCDGRCHNCPVPRQVEKPHIGQIVIGCESGPKARPCDPAWVRDLVEQGREANVSSYVKQLRLDGRLVHDPAEFLEDLRVRDLAWRKP